MNIKEWLNFALNSLAFNKGWDANANIVQALNNMGENILRYVKETYPKDYNERLMKSWQKAINIKMKNKDWDAIEKYKSQFL